MTKIYRLLGILFFIAFSAAARTFVGNWGFVVGVVLAAVAMAVIALIDERAWDGTIMMLFFGTIAGIVVCVRFLIQQSHEHGAAVAWLESVAIIVPLGWLIRRLLRRLWLGNAAAQARYAQDRAAEIRAGAKPTLGETRRITALQRAANAQLKRLDALPADGQVVARQQAIEKLRAKAERLHFDLGAAAADIRTWGEDAVGGVAQNLRAAALLDEAAQPVSPGAADGDTTSPGGYRG